MKDDPELSKQINAAKDGDQAVEAVFSLRPVASSGGLQSPDEFESLARSVLARVEEETGVAPERVNLYRSIGSCAVRAPASFVRKLQSQAEVVSATASKQPEDLLIRPVGN